ncbi:tetratricopeptide repeat protein [Planctomycetota bacterium]
MIVTRNLLGRRVWVPAVLACVLVGCGPDLQDPPPPRAMEQLRLVEQHLSRRSYDEAIREAELAERIAPNSFTVKMTVARVYRERGWTERAIAKYVEADELDSSKGTAQQEIGRILIDQRRFAEAHEALDEAVSENDGLSESHLLKGLALMMQSRNSDASQAFQECLRVDGRRHDAYVFMGVIELRNGYFDEAEKQLRTALTISSQDPLARHYLGETYLRQKRYDRAEVELKQAASSNAEIAESYYYLLGLPYHAADRRYAARRRLKGDSYTLLGVAYKEMGKAQHARGCWRKAVDQDPKNEAARKWLRSIEDDISRGKGSMTD